MSAHPGTAERRKALGGADYVVNAIQVGGYKPSTVIDFEIPAKYGLRQTIADTLGIGGIFRGLRTIPVLRSIAADMAEVCPDAWFLNYSNPMSILTMALLRHLGYYVTESSEHNAEYSPWWIKGRYPELVERFNIPLDEYPRRCERQIAEWQTLRDGAAAVAIRRPQPDQHQRATADRGSRLQRQPRACLPCGDARPALRGGTVTGRHPRHGR